MAETYVKPPGRPVDVGIVHLWMARSSLGPLRLLGLLVLLGSLLAYSISSGSFGRTLQLGGDSAGGGSCPSSGAPPLARVTRGEALRLRAALLPIGLGRSRRLYEEGPAASGNAWSDAEPGMHRSLPAGAELPGGYEIRWWLPSGDDLGADAWAFARPSQAREFFERASSARCRRQGADSPAPSPPGGRDLGWRNPDGAAQEDLFLRRGRLVYRVVVVLAGPLGEFTTPSARRFGFAIVNQLACELPDASCGPPGSGVPALAS